MERFKIDYWTISEIFMAFLIGMLATQTILRNVYELNGISFIGNTSVIWFSVSYLIYVTGTFIRLLIWKNSESLKKRIKGYSFWAVLLLAIILLLIPIFKGEIPY